MGIGSLLQAAGGLIVGDNSRVGDLHTGLASTAQQNNSAIAADAKEKSGLKDAFWDYADLDPARWNQLFPYRLALYKRVGEGANRQWQPDSSKLHPYTLPVSPESLTVSMPFAVTTSVTLGGVGEEHNGVPLRMITIQGTTGALPLRGSPGGDRSGTFGAVSASIGILVGSVKAFTSATFTPGNVVSDFSGDAGQGTGYYQFHLLQRFLEAYANLKTTNEGRDFILALEMWKDQEIYLCSPMTFERRRTAATPLEYQFTLQLKAWRRIRPSLDGAQVGPAYNPAAANPDLLSKVLVKFQQARVVLEAARTVLNSININLESTLFAPMREATLFIKDLLGVTMTAIDLPAVIITEMKEPILETVRVGHQLSNTIRQAGDPTADTFRQSVQEISDAFSALSISSSKAETGGSRGKQAGALGNASPANKIAENPTAAFNFFQNVIPAKLNLRPSTQSKILAERRRVANLKREDFEKARDSIMSVLNAFQNAVGAGHPTYTRIYGLQPPTTTRTPTDLDYDLIHTLNQAALEMSRLAVSASINRGEIETMDFFAGLAQKSGMAFQVPQSKFLVPFPYGHTLEQLAALYLGNADRWIEIAALNGLQAPYVDEQGFVLPLLANGNGNTIAVADASNLFVNQPVWLGSQTTKFSKRHVTKILKITDTYSEVQLDGLSDLNQFKIANSAYLQAFLPNTVNSQMSLFIPSDVQTDDHDFRLKSIPGVDYFDPLVRVGGVDLLLTPAGDLVITPDGHTRLAVGLTNIVQKIRLALNTPRGSLLHHPDWGFPIQIGDSTAVMSAQDILNACRSLFQGDPTFTGVESAAILKMGPAVTVSLAVGIAGTQKVIPVTVDIPR